MFYFLYYMYNQIIVVFVTRENIDVEISYLLIITDHL